MKLADAFGRRSLVPYGAGPILFDPRPRKPIPPAGEYHQGHYELPHQIRFRQADRDNRTALHQILHHTIPNPNDQDTAIRRKRTRSPQDAPPSA